MKNKQLSITFKNVGQGDCIFVEWEEEGISKIGIVDCNIEGYYNPTIFSTLENYSSIEFIVISHPHFDHFSGILDIINFCELRGKGINYIYHTLHYHQVYINSILKAQNFSPNVNIDNIMKSFSNSNEDYKELYKLFKKLKEFKNKESPKVRAIESGRTLYHNKDRSIIFKCLSPHDEKELYLKQTARRYQNGLIDFRKRNNSAANLLSSVICIEVANGYFILTSDAQQYTFERLKNEEFNNLGTDKPIYGFQIPHHGSFDNHYPDFWEYYSVTNSYSFISVGKNSYGHPSKEVVEYFKECALEVHATNHSGFSTGIPIFDTTTGEGIVEVTNIKENYEKNFVYPFASDITFDITDNSTFSVKPQKKL